MGAVKDPGGRISFTDYYTATDSNLGNRGQKYRVYDPKYGGVALNSNIIPPAGTQTGDAWRYQVYATAGQYSGQFTYDSQGRPLTVLKLQAATAGNPSSYRYVTTQTSYSSEPYVITSPDASWGQATQVVEDYGGINRTIRNMAYTSWGKPCNVIDGAGHQFVTSFDGDGKVLYVTLNGNNVVTYTYGTIPTTGITSNGLPVSVVDNLSGVEQDISYQASGPGIGQPGAVAEKRGGSTAIDNQCLYAYGPSGDRSMATYCSGLYNGNGSPVVLAQWGYYDYIGVGNPSKGAHAFQTLCKLDGSGNRTSEEFHYAYDAQGRLYEAAFAQTPSNNTPDSSGYYDGHLAQTRARAHYEYDGGGRLTFIANYWDTLSSGQYGSEAIIGQGCDYEYSAPKRGVKLDAKYYVRTTAGQPNWTLSQTDTYAYDSSLDYLTGATYGDGLANASPTWSYDAAGNRNDAVTDNLNRATTLGSSTCMNDILGNRITSTSTSGTTSYTWDVLSRMTSFANSSGTTSYTYRADGMRTYKSSSNGSTSYRYDGQMGMEDIDTNSSGITVTDYGIGARGIDAMYVTQGSSTAASYPLYDTHGNMISTLSKQGTGGYTYTALRTFDAWGMIRRGAQAGDPKGRYCASLGHKEDDESGLTYMRARYYEANTGRFVNQDPDLHGLNWFVCCENDPMNSVDTNGRQDVLYGEIAEFGGLILVMGAAYAAKCGNIPATIGLLMGACGAAALGLGLYGKMSDFQKLLGGLTAIAGVIVTAAFNLQKLSEDSRTAAMGVVITLYLTQVIAALVFAYVGE